MARDMRLGGPLFLLALIILRAKWEVQGQGREPPSFQSAFDFMFSNCKKRNQREERERDVVATIRIVHAFIGRAGVVWPAWLVPEWIGPVNLSRRRDWVKTLGEMNDTSAIDYLRSGLSAVPPAKVLKVEREYNEALRAAYPKPAGMIELKTGQLYTILCSCCTAEETTSASSQSAPQCTIDCIAPSCADSTTPGMQKTFYYIAAGIGSGIVDIEMEGFTCVGACEKDPYCREVLARHHPNVPLHDNINTLDLYAACGSSPPLSVVVLSTPCVDVSSRGNQLAQQGEVCFHLMLPGYLQLAR